MHQSPTPTREFRTDIVGLRALAVISVVLFHFGVAGWSGGFIGVDIFFVISGFLMTMLVVQDIERGRFSVWNFYLARARRIAPALLCLCALLLAAGALWLTPPDYSELAQQSAWAALFASNFDFLRDLGYFNVETRDAWLLHTWSLSVEWQFYLLFPLVIVGLRRWLARRELLLRAMAAVGLLSFLLCVVVTPHKPVLAFYLLPTRAWELLAGGLVFLAPQLALTPLRSRWLCVLGLAAIAASIWRTRPDDAWPGYAAALPVLGTMLVLAAQDGRNRLLGNRIAQAVGNSSYSIYLWHWPVVVAFDQLGLRDDLLGTAAGIALSLLLGALSWRFVETPGRRWFAARPVSLRAAGFAAGAMLVAGAGIAISTDGGLPSRANMRDYARYAEEVRYTEFRDGWCVANENRVGVAYDRRYFDCATGDRAAADTVLLWGDSHAGHYAPLVSALAQAAHLRVRVLSTPECSSIFRTEPRRLLGINPDLCSHFKDDVKRSLHDYRWVILASRWDGALVRGDKDKLQGLRETLDLLEREGVHVMVLAQVPLFDTDVAQRYIYGKLFGLSAPTHYPPNAWGTQANDALRALVAGHPHAVFVDPAKLLCRRTDRQCDVQVDDTFAYVDDQHLNMGGALALGRRLVQSRANFLDPRDGGARAAP